MKRMFVSLSITAVVLSLSVGLGSALASSQSQSGGPKISVASTGLGRILVDGRGHTLYLFAKDTRGKSACTGACAGFWPPLLATGKSPAGVGVKPSLLGTTRRPDGRSQVTYNHHPLYLFAKDTRKGQTNGEEVDAFGAEWYVVSAAGAKVEKEAAPSGTTGAPAAGGYSNDYSSGYSSGY
jgi:predicted lipoprotein with Yx(FWY)xxD motif